MAPLRYSGAESLYLDMGKLFLVRHGESLANTKGIYQGQTHDTSLSKLGKKQADALLEYFKAVKLSKIYTSPLKRTIETAKKIAELQNITITKNNSIMETNHGLWEGLYKDVIKDKWLDIYNTWQSSPSDAVFPQGDSFKDTKTRVIKWFEHTLTSQGNTLVVTHDNIIRIIVSHILKENLDNIWEYNIQAASITIIVAKRDHTFKILKIGQVNHLDNLLADLSLHAL